MKKVFCAFLLSILFSFNVFAVTSGERRALSVPSSVEHNMNKLVYYLIQGEKNDYEKAKIIAIWIATHIAYDNYTFAAGVGKQSGQKVSSHLKKGAQDADTVFKTRIGTCVGYADLYQKMLSIAGISAQKIHGYALTGVTGLADAKHRIRSETVGHAWNSVSLPGKKILVDITWMGQGQAGQGSQRLTTFQKNKELRQIKRERPTYGYRLDHFDFHYKDLQKMGEYRFDRQKNILNR